MFKVIFWLNWDKHYESLQKKSYSNPGHIFCPVKFKGQGAYSDNIPVLLTIIPGYLPCRMQIYVIELCTIQLRSPINHKTETFSISSVRW